MRRQEGRKGREGGSEEGGRQGRREEKGGRREEGKRGRE